MAYKDVDFCRSVGICDYILFTDSPTQESHPSVKRLFGYLYLFILGAKLLTFCNHRLANRRWKLNIWKSNKKRLFYINVYLSE